MHGPTFMANPLACAIAVESLKMLNEQDMASITAHIEEKLKTNLEPARSLPNVADVRVLGTIGVIEVDRPVDVGEFQKRCVTRGVWIRPFGKNVYIMPSYIFSDEQIDKLTTEMIELVKELPQYGH